MGLLREFLIWRKRKKLGIQIKEEQLIEIINVLNSYKHGVNFLIFGVGNDTIFWLSYNKKGKTLFIEDDVGWLRKIQIKYPKAKIILVRYNTKRKDWKRLLNQPKKLILKLPKNILKTKWDVILVDAPRGWKDEQPGRMKSIFMASKLVKKGGHVFVHDCYREVEKVYSDKYLKQENLIKDVDGLRHYLLK